jgi:hypothetical protein
MKAIGFLNSLLAGAVLFGVGCGPSKEERDRAEKARMVFEEKSRQEAEKANRAISEMTDRAFRKRTPEEEEKFQAEKARQLRDLLAAQKKADEESLKAVRP